LKRSKLFFGFPACLKIFKQTATEQQAMLHDQLHEKTLA